MSIVILISVIIAIIGLIMIDKVGNYENIWGLMFYSGVTVAVVFGIVKTIFFFLIIT